MGRGLKQWSNNFTSNLLSQSFLCLEIGKVSVLITHSYVRQWRIKQNLNRTWLVYIRSHVQVALNQISEWPCSIDHLIRFFPFSNNGQVQPFGSASHKMQQVFYPPTPTLSHLSISVHLQILMQFVYFLSCTEPKEKDYISNNNILYLNEGGQWRKIKWILPENKCQGRL